MAHLLELAERDVVTLPLGDGRLLLQAIDVAVGIGSAPSDTLSALSLDVGYYVARTAAAELWSLGVKTAVAAVAIGDRGAADEVMEGVRTAFLEMGEIVPTVRSTENYVDASVSSVSVAVSGVSAEDSLMLNRARAGNHALLLGGGYARQAEVQAARPWPLNALAELLEQRERLVQVVPVGSAGVERDLENLRRSCGLALSGVAPSLDLSQPGGPGLQFLVITNGPVKGQYLTPLGHLTRVA